MPLATFIDGTLGAQGAPPAPPVRGQNRKPPRHRNPEEETRGSTSAPRCRGRGRGAPRTPIARAAPLQGESLPRRLGPLVRRLRGVQEGHLRAMLVEVSIESGPLERFRRGEIDLDTYVDLKVEAALAHLLGLPALQLEKTRALLRAKIAAEPELQELIRKAT